MMQFHNYGYPAGGGFEAEGLSPVTTDLWAWHDASDAESLVIVNSDEVSQWNDLSGNAHHLSGMTAARPRYATRSLNGLPVVDFNGALNGALYWDAGFGSIAAASDNTVFIVAQSDMATVAYALMHARDTDTVNDSWGLMIFTNPQAPGNGAFIRSYQHSNDGTNGAHQSNAGSGTNADPHIYGMRREGSEQKAILDNSYGNIAPAVDATPTGAMYLAGRFVNGNVGNSFDGIVAEVLLYDRALNQTEIDQNLAYLQDKWGLD